MNFFLVDFEVNWADEMDVQGFAIVTEAFAERLKFDPRLVAGIEWYIGTNERVTIRPYCFSFKYISPEMGLTLVNLFTLNERAALTENIFDNPNPIIWYYGHFPASIFELDEEEDGDGEPEEEDEELQCHVCGCTKDTYDGLEQDVHFHGDMYGNWYCPKHYMTMYSHKL